MPNTERRIEFLTDFTGGLNKDKTHRHIADNELEVADNVDFSERGGVQKRHSFQVHKTIVAADIKWIFEWNMSGGESELIAVLDNGDLIKVSDETTIGNTSFISAGFDYEVLHEYLYLLDGNNFYRIDDDVFNMEEAQPEDTSFYDYFAEEFQEVETGDYNLEFDELKVDSETVQDSFGEKGEYTKGTDYTMDYDNGVLTILDTDIVGDTIFIEYEYYAERDVDLDNIKKCTMLERHLKSNRFFYAGDPSDPAAIYYSEPLEPNNVPGHNVVYPTTNDGPVQALATLDDMLLVFFRNSVFVWRGIDPQIDAVWEKLPLKHGTYNRRTLEYTMNALTFLDQDGIYSLNSLKDASNITDNKITEVIKSVGNKNNIVAKFDSSQSKYFLAYSEEAGVCNKLLMGDWGLGAFSIWDGLEIEDMEYTLAGELYICKGEDILKLTTNYINDTSWNLGAMGVSHNKRDRITHMKARTKELLLGHPYSDKLIYRVWVSLNNYTDYTKLKVITDEKTTEFDVTAKTERFDVMENTVVLQVELEDDSDEHIIMYDVGIEYKHVMTYRSDKR